MPRLETVETERLILRAWTQADLHALPSILGDPEVMTFSDKGPLDAGEQMQWLEAAVARADGPQASPVWAVQERSNGQALGYVSLSQDPKRTEPDEIELGFRLARAAWGQGLATEAVQSAVEYGKRRLPHKTIVAIVDPNNRRSVRVLEKLGMCPRGDVWFPDYDHPDHRYVLPLNTP